MWTVRMRLTALYTGLFIVTVTGLLIVVNVLLKRVLVDKLAVGLSNPIQTTIHVGADTGPVSGGGKSFDPKLEKLKQLEAQEKAQDVGQSVLAYQWAVTWIAVVVLAVIAVAVGWWLAGRVLRPLQVITATARRLSLSNLDERIALAGPLDELKELADTFDAMLERLERAAVGQRQFVANASHELRTPLAIQRAAIEIGLENPSLDRIPETREQLLQANLRTEKLIEGLLMLAQGERGLDHREPVQLERIIVEITDQHRDLADSGGVALEVELEPVTVSADPVLLARLAGNLVHNAIKHNHRGGRVLIRTSPDVGLTVRNTGPGVPAHRVPELFEPFRRLHAPRTGTSDGVGLGLSIVAAIADAHDAKVSAAPNTDGGLTVSVSVPALTPT
ncbi:HAMP domain-containing histidine kinase [Actinomadura sp. HBU206391]|nr:HAMP domain-containing histidine kinase [Actinomadura sp. HBU206391]